MHPAMRQKAFAFALTSACYALMLFTNVFLPWARAFRTGSRLLCMLAAPFFASQLLLSFNFVCSIWRVQHSDPGYLTSDLRSDYAANYAADQTADYIEDYIEDYTANYTADYTTDQTSNYAADQIPNYTADYANPEGFCARCNATRPALAHHCRRCGKCVALFDHHCAFLDACVGARNFGVYSKVYVTGSLWGFFGVLINCFCLTAGAGAAHYIGLAGSLTGCIQYGRGYFRLCAARVKSGIPPRDAGRPGIAVRPFSRRKIGGSYAAYLLNPLVECEDM